MKNAVYKALRQEKRKHSSKLIKELAKLTNSYRETFWFLKKLSRVWKRIYMTQKTIGDQVGYCRVTINRAVGVLHELGFLIKCNRGVKISCLYSFDFPKSSNLFSSNCYTIYDYSVVNSISSSLSPRICGIKSVVGQGGGLPKTSTRGLEWIESLQSKLSDDDKHLLTISALDSGCMYCETAAWMYEVPILTCECNPIARLELLFDHQLLAA
jgi:hypothetical protein